MHLLINLLLLGIEFQNTGLDSLHNKWAIGAKVFDCNKFSLVWTPAKTFAIGIEGSDYFTNAVDDRRKQTGGYKTTSKINRGRIGVRFYKYSGTGSISKFISLAPYFQVQYQLNKMLTGDTTTYEYITYTYGAVLSPGAEYFFKLGGKQLSFKIMATLIEAVRNYNYYAKFDESGWLHRESSISNFLYLYLPTKISVNTFLCLHF